MVERARPRPRVAILAGGRGSRLGADKPSVAVAGRPLISYPLQAARAAELASVVVAKPGTSLPDLDCEVIREPAAPVHPLLGILAAIAAGDGPVIALGCDMPFVTPALLDWLADRDAPAVASVAGRLEPLLAVYGPNDATFLEPALAERAPLREAAARLDPELLGERDLARFGDPRRLVMSINTEADLAEAQSFLAG